MKFLEYWVALFKSLRQKEHFTGLDDTPRNPTEVAKDYLHEERVAATPPQIWFDKPTSSPYDIENQEYTSSCVPHAVTMSWSIAVKTTLNTSIRLSKMFLYRLRSNFPSPGSNLPEMMDKLKNTGSCLYPTLPDTFSEQDANKIQLSATLFLEAESTKKDIEYFKITNARNIDLLASVAAKGFGVALLIFATEEEWAQTYPQVIPGTVQVFAPIRHGVCIIDKGGFIENGKKYVTVVDSAHFGEISFRYLSEDFINQRVFAVDGAAYFAPVTHGSFGKPTYTFTAPLKKDSPRRADVTALQKILVYEHFLPNECVTGYFGPRTEKAVIALQNRYAPAILTPAGLTQGTGIAGPSTINWLNQHYSQ